MSKQSMQLTELDKHIIDVHHTLKTTVEKLDYINSKISEPITKTVYYRMLKNLEINPETSNCVNKGFFLYEKMDLIGKLDDIQDKISQLGIQVSLQNMKKHTKLNGTFIEILNKIRTLEKFPHTLFIKPDTKKESKSEDWLSSIPGWGSKGLGNLYTGQ